MLVLSEVEVCFEFAPASADTKSILAVEDATVVASMPDTVIEPVTDLSCDIEEDNVYFKFVVGGPKKGAPAYSIGGLQASLNLDFGRRA